MKKPSKLGHRRIMALRSRLADIVRRELHRHGWTDREAAQYLSCEHVNVWRVRTRGGEVSLEMLLLMLEHLGYRYKLTLALP